MFTIKTFFCNHISMAAENLLFTNLSDFGSAIQTILKLKVEQ